MNTVSLIGRLTKDPELKNSGETSVTSFTIAVDRISKPGEEKKADFPQITSFGKQAENCVKCLSKGSLVGVAGKIQTGSYKNKEGITVYTTDVVASTIEFLERKKENTTEISENKEIE